MHLTTIPWFALALLLTGCPKPAEETGEPAETAPPEDSAPPDTSIEPSHVVLAWPARAMNTMDPSYATASLRPPGVTLRAQVLERGLQPRLVDGSLPLAYRAQDSAQVSGATDFWEHAPDLLGEQAPAEGLGLSGLGLEGALSFADGLYEATSVPVVPPQGAGDACFPLFDLSFGDGDSVSIPGLVVAPSSWDLGCDRCHGADWSADILARHDANVGTSLVAAAPVRCGACHAQPDLGWEGGGASVLAAAMHGAHADRLSPLESQLEPACLACHPGPDTPFLRGNHAERDISCTDCHGDMVALTAPDRVPWQDLPRCEQCHQTTGSEYQQAGVSFGDSVGHGGLRCPVCHHAPHALYASELPADNAQNLVLQGYAGVVSTCRVCHDPNPGGIFPHVVDP
jgi:hypothetical protein